MNIESTYFHEFCLSRTQDIKNEWGATEQVFALVPSLQFIKCAFSQINRKYSSEQKQSNRITYEAKLFCDASLDIRPGDWLQIYCKDKLLGEYKASVSFLYDSHQEVGLLREVES